MAEKRKRWSYDEVYNYFQEQNCELLSTSFNRQKDTLDYICSCGNKSKINFDNFRNGKRCEECKKTKCGKVRRLTYDDVKSRFEEFGCVLISREYKNNSELLEYICVCGKPNKITLMDISVGKLCFKCGQLKLINAKNINGSAPSSRQQDHIARLINAEINHPVKTSWLDMVFLDEKIYIEYDGSGHRLRVALGSLTNEEFNDKERARTYGLLRDGWREIRIISKRDKLPSDEKIRESINYALEYLNSGRHWIRFDVDLGTVSTSQFNQEYEFGKLTKLDSKKRKLEEARLGTLY